MLNPQGVRFGSSEIYECVESLDDPDIEDALVVGQPTADRTDERVVLFLQLRPGAAALDEEKVKRIKAFIRTRRSPRHVPEVIVQVEQVPYTVNGKKVRLATRL